MIEKKTLFQTSVYEDVDFLNDNQREDIINYTKSIEEYNKYMNRIADKLNKSLDEMNNIWKVWSKIRDKYRKIDKS